MIVSFPSKGGHVIEEKGGPSLTWLSCLVCKSSDKGDAMSVTGTNQATIM